MKLRLKSLTKWVRRRYFGSAWYVKVKAGISAGELDIRHSGSIVSIRLARDNFQEDGHAEVSSITGVQERTALASAQRPVLANFRVGYE